MGWKPMANPTKQFRCGKCRKGTNDGARGCKGAGGSTSPTSPTSPTDPCKTNNGGCDSKRKCTSRGGKLRVAIARLVLPTMARRAAQNLQRTRARQTTAAVTANANARARGGKLRVEIARLVLPTMARRAAQNLLRRKNAATNSYVEE